MDVYEFEAALEKIGKDSTECRVGLSFALTTLVLGRHPADERRGKAHRGALLGERHLHPLSRVPEVRPYLRGRSSSQLITNYSFFVILLIQSIPLHRVDVFRPGEAGGTVARISFIITADLSTKCSVAFCLSLLCEQPILARLRTVLDTSDGRVLKRAFETFDSNRNGKLSEAEFLDATRSLKVTGTHFP